MHDGISEIRGNNSLIIAMPFFDGISIIQSRDLWNPKGVQSFSFTLRRTLQALAQILHQQAKLKTKERCQILRYSLVHLTLKLQS